jgi:hypothetical protein
MIKMKTVFTSNSSFQEAIMKAQAAGFTVTGQVRNPRGQFVVFAQKNEQTNRNTNPNWWRGKI